MKILLEKIKKLEQLEKAADEAENDIYNRYSDIIEEMPNKNNAFSKK